MCELFGITSVKKVQVNELLGEFFSHSDKHPHGWGMALFFDNYVSLEKEPVKAVNSNYLQERLKHPLRASEMIAHIRLATRGELKYANCHPYIKRDNYGRCWTLAHNGTVFETHTLEAYKNMQEGSTDSECVLYYFLDHIDQEQMRLARPLNEMERFELLERLIYELSPKNKLNLLFYDGEYLYAHSNYAHSLYCRGIEEGILLATVPLDKGVWEEIPFARLMVYKGSNVTYEGKRISEEYIEKPEQNITIDGIKYTGL